MSIRYAYYGDDFTGSTDVLEQLASNGIPAILFLGVPTQAQLRRFPEVEAIGIAGESRSRSPEWMSAHLPRIFAALAEFHAPIVHYKVCSTFDSSPTHGSIGRAIELGLAAFRPRFVPIVAGALHLRRYVAFGNLFAAAPDGQVHRIDRHPMAHHPVTPMREPDLRRHLQLQSKLPCGLVDLTSLTSVAVASDALEAKLQAGNQAVFFDTVNAESQLVVGEIVLREAARQPIFSASSSGLTAALIGSWSKQGLLEAIPQLRSKVEPSSPLLVVSGSCSPVTERQIRWALDHGFHGLHLRPEDILTPGTIDAAATWLAAGRDTIVYTALGSPQSQAHGESLGVALGKFVNEVRARANVRRLLLCGGDTSSYAVQQLGLYALTWIANLQPGAPLCRAHAEGRDANFEIVLKGGQVGTEEFFQIVRDGG